MDCLGDNSCQQIIDGAVVVADSSNHLRKNCEQLYLISTSIARYMVLSLYLPRQAAGEMRCISSVGHASHPSSSAAELSCVFETPCWIQGLESQMVGLEDSHSLVISPFRVNGLVND